MAAAAASERVESCLSDKVRIDRFNNMQYSWIDWAAKYPHVPLVDKAARPPPTFSRIAS